MDSSERRYLERRLESGSLDGLLSREYKRVQRRITTESKSLAGFRRG